ncbi:MAG: 50S ribosomal protein L3 N(5)-glutamine methyltransferase [Planctomycetota bacterium]|nr:50S ribosomal protein L3 N(5)-glutamine methyltransferase [Planctomycetota bacterium]
MLQNQLWLFVGAKSISKQRAHSLVESDDKHSQAGLSEIETLQRPTAQAKRLEMTKPPSNFSDEINDLESIEDYYRYALTQLNDPSLCFRNGMGSAEGEVVFLLGTCLNLNPDQLSEYSSSRLVRSEREQILSAIRERRTTKKPMAYILNTTWYCGHRLYIDEGALIPRSALGTMLEDYFQSVDPHRPWSILDMGTGSGGIAVAFAQSFPAATLVASEVFPEALSVARKNVEIHGLGDRVSVIESDLFDAVPEQIFDWILCNPPYVSEDFKQVMSKEYSFEPEPALFGGESGFKLIIPLITEAPKYLAEDGKLFIEMGDITGERFRNQFPSVRGEWYCHPESGQPVILILNRDECTGFGKK